MDIEVWGYYDCILDVVLMDSKQQMWKKLEYWKY